MKLQAVQHELVRQKAVLIYYKDVPPAHPEFEAVQFFGVRGLIPAWEARLNDSLSEEEVASLCKGVGLESKPAAGRTRGEFLKELWGIGHHRRLE